MNRKTLYNMLVNGDVLSATDEAALKLPSVPSTIRKAMQLQSNCVEAKHVPGSIRKTILTLTALEMTVRDTEQGNGIKILDMPEGAVKFVRASGSLTFTTTSVLADTLNLSKVLNWSVGTAAQSGATLATTQANIIPLTAAVSSATVDTANTATTALAMPGTFVDGSTTAADVYLNLAVPTATDIDADATVEINGTITLEYQYIDDQTVSVGPSRMPTASIWASIPFAEIQRGEVDGVAMFEDFTGNFDQETNQAAGVTVTTKKSINHGGWSAFTDADASSTVTSSASAPYGVVQVNVGADNVQTALAWGGNAASAGQLVIEAGKRFCFETRVKITSIADSKSGAFIGFGEEGLLVATGILADAGTLADKDLIGFHRLEADGDKLDIVHNTAGGGGVTTAAADAITIAADTWIKIGMVGDGTNIQVYADGAAVGDPIAYAATNVPDGEELCLYYVHGGLEAQPNVLSVDWVKFATQRA